MSQEHRLKTAAEYSGIWDGEAIKRIRALDGVTVLHGRRLSMHIMVQPGAAATFFSDPILRDQGLLSRFLVAAPESIAGTRMYRDTSPSDETAIRRYGGLVLNLLETSWPLRERNELEPRSISMSAPAKEMWRRFFDEVEVQLKADGSLHGIKDAAAKSAEQAGRLAGVLAIVGDPAVTEINDVIMTDAVELSRWYVHEALRLHQAARTNPALLRAQRLLDWLDMRAEPETAFRDIVQFGPNEVRQKAAADDAVAVLVSHGWVTETNKRPRRISRSVASVAV
jgi:hypothetical protein